MNRPNDENKVGIFIARVITFFRDEKNCPIRIITDNRKVKSRYSYMLPSNFLPSISKKIRANKYQHSHGLPKSKTVCNRKTKMDCI